MLIELWAVPGQNKCLHPAFTVFEYLKRSCGVSYVRTLVDVLPVWQGRVRQETGDIGVVLKVAGFCV